MNAALLVAILGVAVAAITGITIPLYLQHRATIKEREKDEDITWEAINRAIVKERDELKKDLRDLSANHAKEIRELEKSHNQQIREMVDRHENERRILQEQIDVLHRRLNRQAGSAAQ